VTVLPLWFVVLVCFGVNFALWGAIGGLRLVDAGLDRVRSTPRSAGSRAHRARREPSLALVAAARAGLLDAELAPVGVLAGAEPLVALGVADVAVLMAAHNEEVVIDDSLAAITGLVPARNVHVVSDFSSDRTVELARRWGVNVTETPTNVGKAGALELGIREFDLVARFGAVLLLDADTRLDPDYFAAALPLLDDPRIAAVAGCAHSQWRRGGITLTGRLLTAHRSRIYAVTQRLLKYGQTWRCLNATHIVPGFASLYRSAVLPYITINPAGLVIEDFNMTFEVYRKKLGRVGFTVAAKAYTQDPDTLHDYVRQTKRWSLGLWQTVRRHRLRPDLLSAVVGLLLLELVTASVMFLLLPIVVAALAVPELVPAVLRLPEVAATHSAVADHLSLHTLLVGDLLPDYLLTCAVAVIERQPRYLLYGLAFMAMRTVDAGIALYSLPAAWLERSNGRWKSPVRRAAEVTVIDLRQLATVAPDDAARPPSSSTTAVSG
jgi:poly-beta-1,6-N-acetyl-D-glucosamine synthase